MARISSAGAPPGYRRTVQSSAAVAGLVLYVLLALRYVYKTSFVVEGQRYFSLYDDGMICMRFAHNLASGLGLVWNPGERVQGFSNPGLTLVMALMHLTGLSTRLVPGLYQLFSVALTLPALYLTGRLAYLLSENLWVGFASSVALWFFAPFGIWAAQGADGVPLALVLLAAAVQVPQARTDTKQALRLGLTLAAGVFIRLDFALPSLVVGLCVALAARDRRATVLRCLGPIFATVAFMCGASWLYYGDPLPNTYYLKATRIPLTTLLDTGWGQLFGYGGHFTERFQISLCLALLYWPILLWRSFLARLMALVWLAVAVYFVRVGGDFIWHHYSRFLIPAAPFYIVLLIEGARRTAASALARFRVSKRAIATGSLVFAILHVPLFVYSMNRSRSWAEWFSADAVPLHRAENQRNVQDALFVSKYLDEDAVIGVLWAGQMPYQTKFRFVDLLGKVDRHIARTAVITTEPYFPGHSKRDWDYVLRDRRPDVLFAYLKDLEARPDLWRDYCHPDRGPGLMLKKTSVQKYRVPGLTCR